MVVSQLSKIIKLLLFAVIYGKILWYVFEIPEFLGR